MTPDILKLTDNQLAVAAAKAFTEKPWRCIRDFGHVSLLERCKDCRHRQGMIPDECQFPDPLDVTDWNVAKRIADIVFIGSSSIIKYLKDVAPKKTIMELTPQDIIKAALKAKGE